MRDLFTLVARIRTEGLDALQKGIAAADKQLTEATKKIDKFGKQMQRAGVNMVKLTAPLAAVGVAAFKGLDAASDLAETVSKVGQLFGDSAGEIEAWAGTTATTLGQSKQQAMDAASTFAIFGKSAGLTGDKLVSFSQQFTSLASDLASFNNTKPEDAITAIGAALRGEAEPMRRYGVLLDDATMRAKALEMGIISNVKNALTPQQKVLAASALIFDQTKSAQGDFARTSDGLANTTRILKAQIADLTAEFGRAFLPVALQVTTLLREKLLPVVRSMVDWWNNLNPTIKNTVIAVGAFAVAAGPVLIIIGKIVAIIPLLRAAILGLNAALIANPIGLVVTSIGLLVTAGIILWKNWDVVKEKLTAAWDAIAYASQQALSFMITGVMTFIKTYTEGIATVAQYIPILGPAVDKLNAKMDEILAREKSLRYERKIAREETKLQAKDTEKLAEVVKQASQATAEYTTDMLDGVAAKKEDVKVTKEQFETVQKMYNARKEFETEFSDKVRQETSTRLQMLDLEYKEALKRADQLGADTQDVETYYMIERLKLQKEESDKTADIQRAAREKEEEERQKIKDLSLSAINQVFSMMSEATDQELERIDQRADKERAAIENSTLSEEEKQKRIAAIDAGADKKRVELMRRQARRDKAAAIFSAILSTAAGVAKALTIAPPAGYILAAVTGALGAIQIGLIGAQPLPKLADGGLVERRPGGVQTIIGEGNQDELVLPMETGIKRFSKGVIDLVKGATVPVADTMFGGVSGTPALSSAGGGTIVNLNLHGNLITDDTGLKNLQRTLEKFRIADLQRKGKTT